MEKLGFTPQKSIKRAYEQDPKGKTPLVKMKSKHLSLNIISIHTQVR